MVPAVKIERLTEVYSYTQVFACLCIPVYLYTILSKCLKYKNLTRLYIRTEWQVYRYTESHTQRATCIPDRPLQPFLKREKHVVLTFFSTLNIYSPLVISLLTNLNISRSVETLAKHVSSGRNGTLGRAAFALRRSERDDLARRVVRSAVFAASVNHQRSLETHLLARSLVTRVTSNSYAHTEFTARKNVQFSCRNGAF